MIAAGTLWSVLAIRAGGEAADAPAVGSSDGLPALIARLSDPDFQVRREAATRLREMGPAALPALKEAAQGKDPEVRARAGEIVHVLEYQPVPGRPMHARYLRQRKSTTRIIDGRKSIDVDDEGRKITITEDDDGIKMTVVGETNGKPVTRTYTARNPEQLRSDNPEAFAVYQRCSGESGGVEDAAAIQGNVIVQQGNVIVLRQFQPAPVFFPRGGDDLNGLRDQLDQAMDKAKLPPLVRARVHNAVDRVEQTQGFNQVVGPAAEAVDDQVAQYDKACDDLRKIVADNHLPDPGDALPPPKSSRLGVNVQPDPRSGSIVVKHVLPQSRADRIGLQDDDLVRKINGQDVQDVKDLRRLVTDHPKGLVVDVTRDGREMRLEEPK
jgi:hypothetical protein